jgi:hypothetical protein
MSATQSEGFNTAPNSRARANVSASPVVTRDKAGVFLTVKMFEARGNLPSASVMVRRQTPSRGDNCPHHAGETQRFNPARQRGPRRKNQLVIFAPHQGELFRPIPRPRVKRR